MRCCQPPPRCTDPRPLDGSRRTAPSARRPRFWIAPWTRPSADKPRFGGFLLSERVRGVPAATKSRLSLEIVKFSHISVGLLVRSVNIAHSSPRLWQSPPCLAVQTIGAAVPLSDEAHGPHKMGVHVVAGSRPDRPAHDWCGRALSLGHQHLGNRRTTRKPVAARTLAPMAP